MEKYINISAMSFDIRLATSHDTDQRNWEKRKLSVADFINSQGADIVCMQEVTPVQKEDLTERIIDKYGVVWYGRDINGGEGLAIAYNKNKWTLTEQGCFWLSEIPDADEYVIDYMFFDKERIIPTRFEICRDKWGALKENYLSDHYPVKSLVQLAY